MNKIRVVLYSTLVFLLAACGGGGGGGGGGSFTVGGSLSGMGAGKSIVLQNNAGDNLTLTSNASFTFTTALADGAAYAVTVLTQPNGHTCTVNNGSGAVSGANVTNVTVSCVGQAADHFVISGDSNGVLNILRRNEMTGYVTSDGYYKLPTTATTTPGTMVDMAYDAANQHLFVIDSTTLYSLGWNDASGFSVIDSRPTSGSSVRLEMNTAGTAVYVINNGTGQHYVDNFAVDANGVLSAGNSTTNRRALSVTPSEVTLSPDGSHLYVVSRNDMSMDIFTVNSDNSLSASPASQAINWNNVSMLAFNKSGSRAYISRSDTSNTLVVYSVNNSDGSLTEQTSSTPGQYMVEMLVSKDGGHLYAYAQNTIVHLTLNASGDPTFVEATALNFPPNRIAMSYTGDELYAGVYGNLMMTLAVDSNTGNLTLMGSSRLNTSISLVAIGGDTGPLTPTAGHLYAPDQSSGLQKFKIAADGMLTTESPVASTGSLIDGQAVVDYRHSLVLSAGQDASNTDTLNSYTLNANGGLNSVSSLTSQADTSATNSSGFTRIEIGGSGQHMYVLDTVNGWLRSYDYDTNGTITPGAQDSIDLTSSGSYPENMALHPTGETLFIVDSTSGGIYGYYVNAGTGRLSTITTITPGNGSSKPRDIVFHPSGKYAYVSLGNDASIVGYDVDQSGVLDYYSGSGKTTTGLGAGIEPSPLAMHPSGAYLFVGERGTNKRIEVLNVDPDTFTLSGNSSIPVSGDPSWLEVDPQGKFLIVRYEDATIEVFSIAANGSLISIQSGVSTGGAGGYLPSMMLVSPLQ